MVIQFAKIEIKFSFRVLQTYRTKNRNYSWKKDRFLRFILEEFLFELIIHAERQNKVYPYL
jgi:hypothetical protein